MRHIHSTSHSTSCCNINNNDLLFQSWWKLQDWWNMMSLCLNRQPQNLCFHLFIIDGQTVNNQKSSMNLVHSRLPEMYLRAFFRKDQMKHKQGFFLWHQQCYLILDSVAQFSLLELRHTHKHTYIAQLYVWLESERWRNRNTRFCVELKPQPQDITIIQLFSPHNGNQQSNKFSIFCLSVWLDLLMVGDSY